MSAKLVSCYFLIFANLLGPVTYAQRVVVNQEVEIAQLSTSALRTIFTMRRQSWSNGLPIFVFILPPTQTPHRQFCKLTLNVFPYQLQRIWNTRVFSGAGQGPTIVDSDQEMLKRVAETPGAIGYIAKNVFDENVKAITTD